MKPAICHMCGKKLKRPVPNDAEEVTCFACNEREWKRKDKEGSGDLGR